MKTSIYYASCLILFFNVMPIHCKDINNRLKDLMEKTEKMGEIPESEKPLVISELKKIASKKEEDLRWSAEFLNAKLLLINLGDREAIYDFGKLLWKSEKADLSGIAETERPMIISQLKKAVSGIKWSSEGNTTLLGAKLLLTNLGDAEAIKDLVQRYKKSSPTSRSMERLLRNCKQPLFIPLIANDLKMDEKAEYVQASYDYITLPRSFQSTWIIRDILKNSPAFHQDVKKWAESLGRRDDSDGFKAAEKMRNIMRQWWKENEVYFQKKDYGAVRPPQGFQIPIDPAKSAK